MTGSLVLLIAVASAGMAQHGGGWSGHGLDEHRARCSELRDVQWIETLLRWEEMFPPMRGLGFLLAGLDLSRDQTERMAGIVEAADEQIRELERDLVPDDPRRGFFESFVSVDFDPVDLELAVDRVEEFRDEALPVVCTAVDGMRALLTEEQLSEVSDLVEGVREFGPEAGCGWREGMRPRF